jgi:hypothetical protein
VRIRRIKKAIPYEEVGFLRLSYIISIVYLLIISLIFALLTLGNKIEFLINPFKNKEVMGIRTNIFLVISSILILVLLIFIAAILAKSHPRPNSSWNEIKLFSEKKSNKLDGVIFLILISFFVINIFYGDFYWFHFLILILAVFAILLSIKSKKEKTITPIPCPQPLPSPEPPIEPEQSDDYFYRSYEWSSMAGGPFFITDFPLSKEAYKTFSKENEDILSKNNGLYPHLNKILIQRVQGGLTEEVKALLNKISETHQDQTIIKILDNILQFVHDPNFIYSYDKDSKGYTDYARYPVETLVDKTGDCECLAILAAVLFKSHNIDSALLLTHSHCLAGVAIPEGIELPGSWVEDKNGNRYYICEATGSGWKVGQAGSYQNIVEVLPV